MTAARRATRRGRVALGLAAVALAATVGCQEGRAPYPVIDPNGVPREFLPSDGVRPGTRRTDGLIYRFHSSFRLFPAPPDIQPRFVFRDSVLALVRAGFPGANRNLLLHPDESDSTLARVYANPKLFGFRRSTTVGVSGEFVHGDSTASAADFYPVQTGNRWVMDHNALDWTFEERIVGMSSPNPPTAALLGVQAVHAVSTSTANDGRRMFYVPPVFDSDLELSVERSGAGAGIYLHAWRLIAERVVPFRANERPPDVSDRQRNPRFLWLPIGNTFDPSALIPVTADQCLDGLLAHLDFFPLKLADDWVTEGATYRTWTYLTVDTDVLRQRLNTEARVQFPRGGRCGFDFVVGRDTLRMFPTRTYRLLVRFDVAVQRVGDQITVMQGETVLGRYPRNAAPGSVVQFRITMYINGGTVDTPVQLVDLWLQRGIGPVIRNAGLFLDTRSRARLSSAVINGIVYPPDASNQAFEYHQAP